MQNYVEKLKYVLMCVLIFLCTYFLADMISINIYGENQGISEYKILPEEIRYVDYEKNGSIYKAYGVDPQMYLPVTEKTINCLVITFSEPMQEFKSCNLYYASEGEGLSEERRTSYSSVKTKNGGIVEILIEVPEREYSILRLDLDGTFLLEKIELRNGTFEWVKEYQISVFSLIAVILCAILIVRYLAYEKKKNNLNVIWWKWEKIATDKSILLRIVYVLSFFLRFFWIAYVVYICCIASTSQLILYVIPVVIIGIHIVDNECIQKLIYGRYFILLEVCMTILLYRRIGNFEYEMVENSAVSFQASFHSIGLIQYIILFLFCSVLFLVIYIPFVQSILEKFRLRYFSKTEHKDLKQGERNANFFTVVAIIFGILLIYIVPPTTVPDEDYHYASLFRISRGHFFVDVIEEQLGSYYTEQELKFISQSSQDYILGNETYSYEKIIENENIPQGEVSFKGWTRTAKTPIPYLVSAIGVAYARCLFGEMSPYSTIVWAKIFNLLFYVLVTRIALKKTAILKNTMLLIALMPMTIYQCSSVSYDAVLIPCMFLLFAYVTKIVYAEDKYVLQSKEIIAVLFSCFFIFGTKIAYAPLVLVFLAIPICKFGGVKRYIQCIVLLVLTGIISYIGPNYIYGLIIEGYSGGIDNSEQMRYLLSNLNMIPEIIKDTISMYKEFYTQGFVGYFGWFDTKLPNTFIFLYCMLIGISAVIETGIIESINIKFSFLSFVGSVVCFLGTIIVMYTGHNPVIGVSGGTIAYGFQGRYLIPIALFVICCFSNTVWSRYKYKSNILVLNQKMVYVAVLGYLVLMVATIFGRYWM